MEWLKSLFVEHSALQAVVVISLISTIGIGLGKIRFFGISLGVAFIFFAGILAGHFGLTIDPQMLTYAESFGLVVFVYALGLQVGPGFFNSLRADGLRLLSPAVAVVLIGTALAIGMSFTLNVSMPDAAGILCGATTNTPALGAAQQTLQQMGIDPNGAALSCAVTYPLGVVGVILAIVFIRKVFVRPSDMPEPDAEHRKNVFIASYHLTNPAVFGKSVHEIASQSHHHFVISRIWRNGRVSIPTSDKTLQKDDIILVITAPSEADGLRLIFGEQELKDWNAENIDWNAVDSQLISQRILVTRPEIQRQETLLTAPAQQLRHQHQPRLPFGRAAARNARSAAPDGRPPDGRRRSRGDPERRADSRQRRQEPRRTQPRGGLRRTEFWDWCWGASPSAFRASACPCKLGLAGGPIVIGILIGTFGPRLHMITCTTYSANLMLRALGLSMYLACLGLEAGAHFFETVMCAPKGRCGSAGIPADVRSRRIAGRLRAARPTHRFRFGIGHAVRQHGQPDGADLRQRHDRRRQSVGLLRHGLSPLHVFASGHHSGDADDFPVDCGPAACSGFGYGVGSGFRPDSGSCFGIGSCVGIGSGFCFGFGSSFGSGARPCPLLCSISRPIPGSGFR